MRASDMVQFVVGSLILLTHFDLFSNWNFVGSPGSAIYSAIYIDRITIDHAWCDKFIS